ncbi:MAG: head decoration protein [Oscillospiraceae bacterium]|nr:head decoration protein [Oscillospiraceae bacterium]
MNKELVSKVGSIGQDNLIAKLFPPATTFGVTIPAGTGVLKRGTVLALNGDKYALLSAATTGKANCVLADDVDASGEAAAVGVAYRTGHFNRKALIVGEGYTMTIADEEELRKGGILLTDMAD